MSEYLYDEDYDPALEHEPSRLWVLGILLALALAALASKPWWIDDANRYIVTLRHKPEQPALIMDAEVAKQLRQLCSNPQNYTGAVSFTIFGHKGHYVGSGNVACSGLSEVLRGGD